MPKLRHGRGAECSILTKFIHSLQLVRDKHVNLEKTHRTMGVLVDETEKKVNRKIQKCYSFRLDDYPDQLLHAVRKYVTVTKEGSRHGIFGVVDPVDNNNKDIPVATAEVVIENEYMVNDTSKILSGSLNEDIAAMRAAGADIDDDKKPAEDNVPKNLRKVKVK